MESKDNKYRKVEGLLRLYPEIPKRIRNAERFLKLGEEHRAKEIEELKIKKDIVENMLDFLKDNDIRNETTDCEIIKMWYIEKKSIAYIAMHLNMSEKTVWLRRKNVIKNHLMSFMM